MSQIILFLILPLLIFVPTQESQMAKQGNRHILLLGASIGRGWGISLLPERIKHYGFTFEYLHGGSTFDKSVRLREVIARGEKKPDAIFLKECAAYFPGNFELYKSLMEQWVKDCREANVVPIPVTVVPVTRLHQLKKFAIDIVKLRNPFKQGSPFKAGRQRAILEYNDWLRVFCAQNDLSLLDLEQAVRKSEKDRYLRSKLAKMDGLHLNKKAYRVLDQIVIPTLEKVQWRASGYEAQNR